MPLKLIQVGAGSWGEHWCRDFLPPNIAQGLIEVVGIVDINPMALEKAASILDLRYDQCYTDPKKAFAECNADFCTIVVPSASHETIVDLALAHELHILSEKPIADSLVSSVRIAEKVKRSGRKMAVTMSHRFDQDKTTLRETLRSGRFGDLDYLICRFTCDTRKFPTWGKLRYEMADPLLIEGAVHQLDILADLAGAKCETIFAKTWNPNWGDYSGNSQGIVLMSFENGVHALYEGANANAVGLNGWYNDYIRAECRDATVILDRRILEYFPYNPAGKWATAVHGEGKAIPLRQQSKWINTWLIEKFVRWLQGDEVMETNVEDNLQSVALIFSAIESSKTGQPVNVQQFLDNAREEVKKQLN
jgi:predicted dehydrogenase